MQRKFDIFAMETITELENAVPVFSKRKSKSSRKKSNRTPFLAVNNKSSFTNISDTSVNTTLSDDETFKMKTVVRKRSSRKAKKSRRSGKKKRVRERVYTNDSVSIDEDTNQPSLGFQLRTATINNKVHEMERLLRKEPSLVNDAAELGEHGAVESGLTSLHIACQLGLDECVGLLVYHKAEVNAQTEGGNTPLHFACSEGHSSCVDQLINAGAKTHLMDILDQTPKDVAKLACKHEWEMCVNLIEEDEVRFGFKVIKIASGIVTFAVAGFLGYWYWSGHNSGNVKKNSTPKNK